MGLLRRGMGIASYYTCKTVRVRGEIGVRRRERDSESDSESDSERVKSEVWGVSNCGHTNNERFRGYDTVNVIPVERSSSRVK